MDFFTNTPSKYKIPDFNVLRKVWNTDFLKYKYNCIVTAEDSYSDKVINVNLKDFLDNNKHCYVNNWRYYLDFPELTVGSLSSQTDLIDHLTKLDPNIFLPLIWCFIGDRGTGLSLHTDVLSTRAWLAVFEGKKRVVLHPPVTDCLDKLNRESKLILETSIPFGLWKVVDLEPGDILIIPENWLHAALNMEMTLAVTRNFVIADGLENTIKDMKCLGLDDLAMVIGGDVCIE